MRMHQAKKCNQWRFGIKAHNGVDVQFGLVHTVVGTAANVSDVTQASKTAMISTNPQRFIDQEYPAFWQKLMLG